MIYKIIFSTICFIFCSRIVSAQDATSLIAYTLSARCYSSLCGGQIALLNPETGETVVLDSASTPTGIVQWSPQGDQLGFHRNFNIELINIDGSNLRTITSPPHDFGHPFWSPDGTRIATVAGWRTNQTDVYIMNADGSDLRRLTLNMWAISVTAWSPDGTRIYFFGAKCRLCVINADGSGFANLADNLSYMEARWTGQITPMLSPDGTRLAFSWRNEQIYIMDTNGENVRQITPDDGTSRLYTEWVDNDHLIYSEGSPRSIYLINLSTQARTLVVSPPFRGGTDISSDGQQIVYLRGTRTQAYICITNLFSLTERCYENTNPYFDAPPQWQP